MMAHSSARLQVLGCLLVFKGRADIQQPGLQEVQKWGSMVPPAGERNEKKRFSL